MHREEFRERYGLSSWLYADRSIEEALVKIAGAGFKHVELWADQAHLDPRADPDLPAIQALLRQHNLRVHSVHLPFSGMAFGSPDGAHKDTWLRLAGAALGHCAQLGGRIAVVHASGGDQPLHGSRLRDSIRASVSYVYALKDIASRLGITLALENLPAEWSQYGRSLAELAYVFPEQDVGLCLDTGHVLVNGMDMAAELRAAGRRLLEVHANSNHGRADCHLPPSQGALDWLRMERRLAGAGYRGCRILEVHGMGDPDRTLAYLQNLWQHI